MCVWCVCNALCYITKTFHVTITATGKHRGLDVCLLNGKTDNRYKCLNWPNGMCNN